MRIRLFIVVTLLLFPAAVINAAQYSVTEDTSAIGTTIRLQPNQQNTSGSPVNQPVDQQAETQAATSAQTTAPTPETGTTIGTSVQQPVSTPVDMAAGTTSVQTPIDSATAAPADTNQTAPGTIIITSIPDTVSIVINDVSVGSTPYQATGFYPGLYEVTLYKDGFQPFRKSIDLKPGSTGFITGMLQPEAGNLFVTSVPESATVRLNDSTIGLTPVTSGPLTPGMYQLRIERAGYAPYSEQLGVTSKLTDTIQLALVALAKPDIARGFDLKNSRNFRRIAFGSAGIVAATTGFLLNISTAGKLKRESEARDLYMQPSKSENEYTQLYGDYIQYTKKADQSATARNVWYGIAILCGIGFGVSIPF